MAHLFRRLDYVEQQLRLHGNNLGYLTVAAVRELDQFAGNRYRSLARLEWTPEGLESAGIPARELDPDGWITHVLQWLRDRMGSSTTSVGEHRFRVNGYQTGGVAKLVDCTVYMTVEDEDREDTVEPPRSAADVLQLAGTEQMLALLDLTLDTARGAVELTRSSTADTVQHQRDEIAHLHTQLRDANKALADKDSIIERLTRRLVDRDRVELEATLAAAAAGRAELEEKAASADTMDRVERIASTVFELGKLPDKAKSLLPLLQQDDVIAQLSRPELRAVLDDPASRRELFAAMNNLIGTDADLPEEPA